MAASSNQLSHYLSDKALDTESGSSTEVGDQKSDEKTQNFSPEITFPEGGTRAWLVAVGNAFVTFCSLGFVNSFGVFQTYYESNQLRSTSPSAIAWIGSLQAFFLFAGGAVGGPLFDRYGAKVIRPAAIVYVFSIMMTSICKEFWQFLLAQGILGGISNGLIMTPATSATPQYFNKKRGAAMGLAIAGSSLGGVVFPIALGKMFEHNSLGFGWSVRICGFILLALLAFASTVIKARFPPRKSHFFLPGAFREPPYLFLCGAVFFLLLGQIQPLFFLPTYAITQGMSPGLAFYLVAILNGASLPGRILPGILADKLGRFNLLLLAAISSSIIAFCWQSAHSNAAILVWAGIYGFFSGAIVSGITVSLASSTKEPKNIGTYMGMGLAVGAVAALIGSPIAGAMYARYNSFGPVADFSGACMMLGGLFVIPAKVFAGHGMFSNS